MTYLANIFFTSNDTHYNSAQPLGNLSKHAWTGRNITSCCRKKRKKSCCDTVTIFMAKCGRMLDKILDIGSRSPNSNLYTSKLSTSSQSTIEPSFGSNCDISLISSGFSTPKTSSISRNKKAQTRKIFNPPVPAKPTTRFDAITEGFPDFLKINEIVQIVALYDDPHTDIINAFKNRSWSLRLLGYEEIPEKFKNLAKLITSFDATKYYLNDTVTYNLESLIELFRNLQFLKIPSYINDLETAVISKLTNLLRLDLSKSNITNLGLADIAKLSKLQHLNLSDCISVNDDSLSQIATLTDLVHFETQNNERITDTGIDHLKKLLKLRYLDISGCYRITNAALKSISALTELEHLNLAKCREIRDDGLSDLSLLFKIRYLNLQECVHITKEGISYLAALSEIEFLNLNNCEHVNIGAIRQLYPLEKLKILKIVNTNVNRAGRYCIERKMPNLKVEYEENSENSADI